MKYQSLSSVVVAFLMCGCSYACAKVSVFDGGVFDGGRDRAIPYRIYFDESLGSAATVILVSHGGTGSFSGYTRGGHLGVGFAEAGFVAVFVGHLPSAAGDLHRVDRPADVSFLLDRLVDGTAALPGGLWPLLDLDRVGHCGHSYGAYTAHAVGGAAIERVDGGGVSFYTDPRIGAIVALSPQGADQFGFFDISASVNSWVGIEIPVCSFVGGLEIDGNVTGTLSREGWRLEAFARYSFDAERYLFVLPGQDHSDLWSTGSDEVNAFVVGNAVAFFDRALREGSDGVDAVGTSPAMAGVVSDRKILDYDGDGGVDVFDLIEFLRDDDAGVGPMGADAVRFVGSWSVVAE